jgi:hypothetical protein
MPAALRNVTRAWRLASEGSDRTKSGAKTLPFSTEDPEQLGEIAATALGFRPTRVSQNFDRVTAAREIDQFWSVQRALLMDRYYKEKMLHKDEAGASEVIQQILKFNETSPDKKYIITNDALKQSVKSKATSKILIETGKNVPPNTSSNLDKMYPETVVEKKTVK